MSKNYAYVHPADQIVEFMSRIYENGMTTTSGGNLSIKDSDGNIWISPAGIDKGSLTSSDIVMVTPSGEVVGPHRPSSELPFHRSVYKMRPDVKAILHAHPPALVSFSVAAQVPETGAVYPAAKQVCGSVGFAPYEVPGSEALGKKVAEALMTGHNVTLLENHGSCVVGSSMAEAFKRFETLDFCARTLNYAIRLGKTVPLSEAAVAAAYQNKPVWEVLEVSERSAKELELRALIAKMSRRAYRQKLFTSTQGTYAVRCGKDSFLITPNGADRALLDPEDPVLISGNKAEAGKTPSYAAAFVRQLFAEQPDLEAVILAQPPALMGYAVTHTKFDPRVIPESYIVLREVPSFEFAAYANNAGKLVSTISSRYPVVMLQNDCIISAGKNALEAFDRLEVAEYSAQAAICAGALGGMKPINDKQIADLVSAFKLIP